MIRTKCEKTVQRSAPAEVRYRSVNVPLKALRIHETEQLTPLSARSVIVIVAWKGWPDTKKCLQSLLTLEPASFDVAVVDNASPDDSLERLRLWARSQTLFRVIELPFDSPQAENLAIVNEQNLFIVPSSRNRGFAGGNNLGIRLAQARGARYVWLLNNDTVVQPDSLAALEAAASEAGDRALISSYISSMAAPDQCWFEGGQCLPWIGSARHVCAGAFAKTKYPFLTGCALFIPLEAYRRIGPLNEEYFLYGEDVDYSIRGSRLGYRLIVEPRSRVSHKGGGSTVKRSPLAYSHHVRNGIVVMAHHHGRLCLVGAVVYHVLKMGALLATRRIGWAAAKSYSSAILSAIHITLRKQWS